MAIAVAPTKLKVRAAFAINDWLRNSQIDDNLEFVIRSKVADEHIATALLWDMVTRLPSTTIEKTSAEGFAPKPAVQSLQLAVSGGGDLYAPAWAPESKSNKT